MNWKSVECGLIEIQKSNTSRFSRYLLTFLHLFIDSISFSHTSSLIIQKHPWIIIENQGKVKKVFTIKNITRSKIWDRSLIAAIICMFSENQLVLYLKLYGGTFDDDSYAPLFFYTNGKNMTSHRRHLRATYQDLEKSFCSVSAKLRGKWYAKFDMYIWWHF